MSLRWRSGGAALIGLLAALSLIALPSALAKPIKTSTTIAVLNGPSDVVSGRISSPRAPCERARKVTVFDDADSTVIGTVAISTRKGNWKVKGALGLGTDVSTVYAKVAAKRVRIAGKRVRCGSARSAKVDIELPPDADGDGIPDSEDACPSDFAPDAYCPATVYAARQGTVPVGSKIKLTNLWVSAVHPSGGYAWAQIMSGDPGFTTIDYSAIRLDIAGLSNSLASGDRADIRGTVTQAGSEVQLDVFSITETGTSPAGVIPTQSYTDLSDGAAHTLNGLLVRVTDVQLGSISSGVWTMTNNIQVAGDLIGGIPDIYPVGDLFASIDGIAVTLVGPRIQPRSGADFILSSCFAAC